MPSSSAARMIRVPLGTEISRSSIVTAIKSSALAGRHNRPRRIRFRIAGSESTASLPGADQFVTRAASNEALFYYGLPGSMVAAAILTSLGVADRLRQQRHALTEAERRANTDPLTGVLNRRSLLEQLEAVCRGARANARCRRNSSWG